MYQTPKIIIILTALAVSALVIWYVKEVECPAESKLFKTRNWKNFVAWNIAMFDWYWRATVRLFAWVCLSISIAAVLMYLGQAIGVTSEVFRDTVVTLAVVGCFAAFAKFSYPFIAAHWR